MREGTDKTHRWIVDPLDGTTNFLHGIPHFAISIALEREGAIVAGLVYNPVSEELFVAEKGKGAFLNDHRIRVAGAQATLAMPSSPAACRISAAAISNLAAGRSARCRARSRACAASARPRSTWPGSPPAASTPIGTAILKPWDLAAGIILVREAGGYVSDLRRRRRDVGQGQRRRRQRDHQQGTAAGAQGSQGQLEPARSRR